MPNQLTWIGLDSTKEFCIVELKISDQALIGQTLSLNLFLKATPLLVPPPRREHIIFGLTAFLNTPLNEGGNVYKMNFEVVSEEMTLSIPFKLLAKARPYNGQALKLESELEIQYKEQILTTLKLEAGWLGSKGLDHSSLPVSAQDPMPEDDVPPLQTDVFSQNQGMEPIVPAHVQPPLPVDKKTAKLVKIGAFSFLGALIAVLFVFFQGGFNMGQTQGVSVFEVMGGVFFLSMIGVMVYYVPRFMTDGTEGIPSVNLKLSATGRRKINAVDDVKLSELFEASAEIPLDQLRVRLVAVQEERFLYQVKTKTKYDSVPGDQTIVEYAPSLAHNLTFLNPHLDGDLVRLTRFGRWKLYDYQYKEICSQCVIYDKVLAPIPAGTPIQEACQDVLNLDAFFAQMVFPSILNPYFGLHLVWHLQLIHPGYTSVDLVLSELRFEPWTD